MNREAKDNAVAVFGMFPVYLPRAESRTPFHVSSGMLSSFSQQVNVNGIVHTAFGGTSKLHHFATA